jgi:hypothetical protein
VSTFTLAELVAEVRRIAAEQPDHTYQFLTGQRTCTYAPESVGAGGKETQSCLVGQALRALGVPDGFFAHWNRAAFRELSTHLFDSGDLVHGGDPVADGRGRLWLERVQSSQDRGNNWANAVAFADDALPLSNGAP